MLRGRIALAAIAPCAVALVACGGGGHQAQARRIDCQAAVRRFHTLPGLRPTGFCVATRPEAKLTSDKLLVTPRPDPRVNKGEQFGPMIVSTDGKLLWFDRRPDKVHDLKVVRLDGRPALAFWQRHGSSGGYYQLLDERYRPIGRIRAGHGFGTNLHELAVTPDGAAWVSADVKRHGIVEFVVQRVDIATGRVTFQWRSLDHVRPSDSYERRPRNGKPWDYFHGNAIAPPTADDPAVVISSRNTSSLYGVDPATGRTKRILGGKRDQFGLPKGWRFCAQHDAHRLPDGDIMLFDNGGTYMHGTPRCGLHHARAMRLRLDVGRRTARLVRSWPSHYFPGWVGSARLASNGDVLVDWGPNRRVTELGPDGRVDLLLKLQRWSYRAIPARWTGLPTGAPKVAARRRGGVVDVWASWNGATEIRRWRVIAGGKVVATVPFADLETKATVRTGASTVAVEALDAAGNVLGRSALTSARS